MFTSFLYKSFILIFACTVLQNIAFAQTENPINNTTEQQIEDLTNANESENEDDTWLQQLEDLRKHPVNLNYADNDELKTLRILTDLQINSLLSYRKLMGVINNIYELQAIPNWDIETIKKILSFVTIAQKINPVTELRNRFKGGEHNIMLRVSQTVENAFGFVDSTSSGNFYPGSPQRLFLRHRYSYRNLLQYGIVAEKDAGEQLFKGAQKQGFDFYSAHLFARNLGRVKALAIGDFTVNMGQGLIQWQNLAFRKSADAMQVKRSSPVLRPYNSAGEFNFMRGVGATVKVSKSTDATLFASYKNRDANIGVDTSSFIDPEFASSLLTSGLHRTKSEIEDRNALKQLTAGFNLSFNQKRWHVGLNGVYYGFDKSIQRTSQPYNLFGVSGKAWMNASIDYNYTYKNFHYFGESAISKNGGYAFIDGMLLSLGNKMDVSMVLRNIDKKYQAVQGSAFTEGTLPSNESGLYTGIKLRPMYGITIDAYADFYKFPFLRYRVDAPSKGNDYLIQIGYKPNKVVDVYIRLRSETKDQNSSGLNLPTRQLNALNRTNFRAHFSYKIDKTWSVRQRAEMNWFDKSGAQSSTGFLIYTDLIYKPMFNPLSFNVRLQYFEVDDYNSRIYAFENDVLYSFSIPLFQNTGFRYYANINYDVSKKLSLWLRWAQTRYSNVNPIGSGLDEIQGNVRSDFRVQLRYVF